MSMTAMGKSATFARLLLGVATILALFAIIALLLPQDAHAQARNPFNVGISEGGGVPGSGITRWILSKQIEFERMLSGAVRAIKTDVWALWTLMGIAFSYGVFHAAGPGHGKAVVASYMLANETALKRGIIISFMAAVLQGIVAIAIVGVLAVVLNATSARMKEAANFVEVASYAGVALLGAWLVWRKGRAAFGSGNGHTHAEHGKADRVHVHQHTHDQFAHHANPVQPAHGEPGHVHDEHCGHFHAPDPRTLGDGFSWGGAIATVFAAGSRPCSGAILVLVFALAQGIFFAGIAATFAMSLGTALTTGALAGVAVLAKNLASRYAGGPGGGAAAKFLPMLELAAALAILALGTMLFLGSFWR